MAKWKRIPEDGEMKRISSLVAVQTCIRRACLLAREFTGIEVMPDELGAASVEALANLRNAWETSDIPAKKPDSVVNFAACLAVMEWAYAIKKVDNKPYSLNSNVIAAQLDFVEKNLEDLFPGIMGVKDSAQCIYDGICATADGVEKSGWFWTKKMNEPMVCLMSLYPILKAMGKNSEKILQIQTILMKRKD